jgi:hypothetical protein
VASCKVTTSGGNSDGVGTFTYTATATDNAGNTTTQTGTYQVVYNVQYGTAFFQQPINDTAHMTGLATSIFKAGSTVPVKFQLKDAKGNIVTPSSAPVWITPQWGVSTKGAVDESVYTLPADSGSTFRYDSSSQTWLYNWNTSSTQAGYYWRIGVKLDDGKTYAVNIGLR